MRKHRVYGLSVFGWDSWAGKHFTKIKDSEISLEEGSKSFLSCFSLRIHCGFQWLEKWV